MIEARTQKTNWFLILAIVILLVTVGGRTFKALRTTDHFWSDHEDCRGVKARALEPGAHWDFAEALRGPCAFYKDIPSGEWLVIIFALSAGTIILITGYTLRNGDKPVDWLRKQNNR